MKGLFVVAGLTLLLGTSQSFGARKTITWNDYECRYRIAFDTAKADERALRNTVNFLFGETSPIQPPLVEHFDTPDAAARVDASRFQAACVKAERQAQAMKFIDLPGIEEFWKLKIENIRDACAYGEATIGGIRDAAALRRFTPAATCMPYVDALDGRGDLDRTWREVIAESCKNNASPNACAARDIAAAARPDGEARKRLLVLQFGWSTCAVQYVRFNETAPEMKAKQDALIKRFRQQFPIKKDKCQRPD